MCDIPCMYTLQAAHDGVPPKEVAARYRREQTAVGISITPFQQVNPGIHVSVMQLGVYCSRVVLLSCVCSRALFPGSPLWFFPLLFVRPSGLPPALSLIHTYMHMNTLGVLSWLSLQDVFFRSAQRCQTSRESLVNRATEWCPRHRQRIQAQCPRRTGQSQAVPTRCLQPRYDALVRECDSPKPKRARC